MLGILRRVFSFSDHQIHHPLDPPPGAMLDASFDALNGKIEELDGLVRRLLRDDGGLGNGLVTADSLEPGFRGWFDRELAKSVEKLRFELSEHAKNAVSAEKRAVSAADASGISLGRAEIARNALISAEASARAAAAALEVRARELTALAGRIYEGRTDFDDAAGEAQAWADVSMAWAENMPGTIPPNLLAVMDVTGDHWSSRWWANYAAQIVSAGLGIEEAPIDGQQYARSDAAWEIVVGGGGGSAAWADITGKPATFPPTLPIASSGVTGLDAAQAAQDTAISGKLDAGAYTAADVLAKLLTVDGAGSALDADLLDGQSSAFYATASSVTAKLDVSAYTAADVLTKIKTVDGAGSLLDADLLDAQTGTYYLDRANHTGTQASSTITGLGTAAARNIHVGTSAPGSPATNDIWIDTT